MYDTPSPVPNRCTNDSSATQLQDSRISTRSYVRSGYWFVKMSRVIRLTLSGVAFARL